MRANVQLLPHLPFIDYVAQSLVLLKDAEKAWDMQNAPQNPCKAAKRTEKLDAAVSITSSPAEKNDECKQSLQE